LDRAAQLPHRHALHDQSERNDQRGGLRRRQEVQPYRRGDNAECKAGEPGDECRGKRPGEEQREVKCVSLVHCIPHAGRRADARRGMGQRLADRSG